MRVLRPLLLGLMCVSVVQGCARKPSPADLVAKSVPASPREFRAAWVATVANIDWPSKPGLSTEEQQKEAIAILDRAKEINLNAIILQVRTACDALYVSELEPWSEYLTGEQGKAPEPFYDPLKFWIDEAHARGLQLHAWFNPFRARHTSAKTPNAPTHVSNTQPDWVKQYGAYQWMDPGNPEAREHTLKVFMDVVKRYDVDGIHIDDYFYPYPIKETPPSDAMWAQYQEAGGKLTREEYNKANMQTTPFPDDSGWEQYQKKKGKLNRDDWRRENINRMVADIYKSTKKEKKRVQFGISPFGIWKPGFPQGVTGFNQYESLYADAKLWLNEGWCDYYTPQIYWQIESKGQPYGKLLAWWVAENTQKRNLWPGNFTSKLGERANAWDAEEIVNQIKVTREAKDAEGNAGATGNVHFSMKMFSRDVKGINGKLKESVYAEPALVPTSKWLDAKAPAKPKVEVEKSGGGAERLLLKSGGGEKPAHWAVWMRRGEAWKFDVRPASAEFVEVPVDVDAVAVSAVDRLGNESVRAVRVMEGK